MDFHRYVREHLAPLALDREPEIVDELAQHLADLYQEGLTAGCTHDEALARASAALPQSPAELTRAIESATRTLPAVIADRWNRPRDPGLLPAGRTTMFADLRRDLHYALRALLRTPGFTLIVAVTMALGIGANAVIFTAIDALLIRSAPVADPDRVVSVYTANSDGRASFASSSYPDYVSLRDSGRFAGLSAYAGVSLTFDAGGENVPVIGEMVSGDYFSVLGVPVSLGRTFNPDEDRPGAQARVAVLTHECWLNRLAGDPSAVGGAIALNGQSYTVIGVLSKRFVSPVLGRAPEIYLPMALQREIRPPSAGVRRTLGHSDLLGQRGIRWLNMIGRLRDDQTLKETSAAVNLVAGQLAADYPDSNQDRTFMLLILGDGPGVRASARPLMRLLSAAVVLVLLIACANVASLLLARSVSRRREVAVRMALGAGRSRLVRQWLTEAVLLSACGAVGGILLSSWGAPFLHRFGVPASIDLGLNPSVLLFTGLLAVGSGLLFGLAPVIQTLRSDTLAALRDEGGAVASGVRATRLRSAFVVVQVALSLMLLVGAGLFLRTLQNAYAVDLGYRVDLMLLVDINFDVRGYSQDAGQVMYRQILERLQTLPGVQAVGAARVPVLAGSARSAGISADGQPFDPARRNFITVRTNTISDRYLDTMGIPVLRGRNFSTSDTATAPPVAIVTRSLANRLWPGRDPIGQRLVTGTHALDVVGVVPDAIYTSAVERDPPGVFYVPLAQNYESGLTFFLRTMGDPLALVGPVRQAVRELDAQLAVARPRTLEDAFVASVDEQRMMAMLVGAFGIVALALAAVGLYGTMAHVANQRRGEIGIRLALGADPSSIMRLVIAQGLRLFVTGAAIGTFAALVGSRLLEAQLFGIAPTDPGTFAAVIVMLTGVSVLACAIPAWRAMRIDPVSALRH